MSFDGPGAERAGALVEAMFEASANTPPAAGLICASFYVSLDGSRAFNYALWTSAQAVREPGCHGLRLPGRLRSARPAASRESFPAGRSGFPAACLFKIPWCIGVVAVPTR
ncbi:hypothetical protein ACWDA3_42575 [Nonomuraea rubra]